MGVFYHIDESLKENKTIFLHSLAFNEDKFILAPLQNLTSLFFRQTYNKFFPNTIDYAISPFISISDGIANLNKKSNVFVDILPQQNINSLPIVPQILGNNAKNILSCCKLLEQLGYRKVNLNMGCPKKDIVRAKRGAGLLKDRYLVQDILTTIKEYTSLNVSIKVRLGIESPKELESFIDLFNSLYISDIIIHPRTAKQQYEGKVNIEEFVLLSQGFKSNIIYNGDIKTKNDYLSLKNKLPNIHSWCIGRGLLGNPILCAEIKNISYDRNQILIPFIKDLITSYANSLTSYNELAVLNKTKELSKYLCQHYGIDNSNFIHCSCLKEILHLFETKFSSTNM